MKKFLLISVSLCIILALTALFCSANTLFNGKSITGSGKLITQTIDVPAFDGVKASRAVKVVITDKATDKITIEADDNLMKYVVVTTEDNELHVGIDRKLQNLSNINVTVTIPSNSGIRSLKASSAASIHSKVLLNADEFDIDASSAAKINAPIKARKCSVNASSAAKLETVVIATECNMNASSAAQIAATISATDCDLDVSSAAKITAEVTAISCRAEGSSAGAVSLKGSAGSCRINFKSGAKFDAKKFIVKDYDTVMSSGAHATVNCNGVLTTRVSSGASVQFAGEPTGYNHHNSSGGRVSRL